MKLLFRKLWKISRKLYVIAFPFNKIVRLHSTAYYRIKKSTTDTFLELQALQDVLELLENVQENVCYEVPFSKLQVFKLQSPVLPCMFSKFWKFLR